MQFKPNHSENVFIIIYNSFEKASECVAVSAWVVVWIIRFEEALVSSFEFNSVAKRSGF